MAPKMSIVPMVIIITIIIADSIAYNEKANQLCLTVKNNGKIIYK